MDSLKNNFNGIEHRNKELLLKYLIILEMQEKQDNQELVFAFPQKDD